MIINDEPKFAKLLTYDENNKKIVIHHEYFANTLFGQKSIDDMDNYQHSKGMLYSVGVDKESKNTAGTPKIVPEFIVLQTRGEETSNLEVDLDGVEYVPQ